MPSPVLHVVLVAPKIPTNTGSIGRTCLNFGAKLHLIEPLGFSLDSTRLKRAGLDYWPHLDVTRYKDWDTFNSTFPNKSSRFFFSKFGPTNLLHFSFPPVSDLPLPHPSEREIVKELKRLAVEDGDGLGPGQESTEEDASSQKEAVISAAGEADAEGEEIPNLFLVFGSETEGLYKSLGEEALEGSPVISLPMMNPHRTTDIPSFNLASCVTMCCWEVWRQYSQPEE
eukprot:TRINITY_DN12901_c0_g1_i1.p1 TRINITY_DN12901_c0_g1~~TRINITY_DN12901_c0_g1_i1.p1  ORF type:complete len:227 (-),score=54.59 TRINITY_DN12901_c0_g1_i1:125-805(-)